MWVHLWVQTSLRVQSDKGVAHGDTLKANATGIRFELCAARVQAVRFGAGRYARGVPVFCAVHAHAKMELIIFAFGELCEAFLRTVESFHKV